MAELNLKYYTQNDQYSDGDIEKVMLDMAEQGISYEQLPPEKVEFPLIYHFSRIRHNILNWYPFKEHNVALEIGAGCGAITGLLCRKCERVVSVELSKRRASINYARHYACDNLCIMVGNLNDMEFDMRFDYIILNGVLEYAASFTQGEKPYINFLKRVSELLNDDGRILIAIENRIGLKYFAGAPEDHTDAYYLGLDNYKGNKAVRTFSKRELKDLLDDSGLTEYRFYYPYPDYKFPREIFTDKTLESNGYGRPYESYKEDRFNLFEESKVTNTLVSEGVAAEFANSFLVEAGKKQFCDSEEILYAKMNSERKEEFQIATVIREVNGERQVVKKALTKEAVPFIEAMIESGKKTLPAPYHYLSCEGSNGELHYGYVNGKTMFEKIHHFVKRRDGERIVDILKGFYETYFAKAVLVQAVYTQEFCSVFGNIKGKEEYLCISPANIDLISDNIFYEESKSYIIDYEWVLNFPVPVAFIMWRMMNDLYNRIPELDQVIERFRIQKMFDIDNLDHEVFLEWSKNFAYVYVGCDKMSAYAKPGIPLNLNHIANEYKKEVILFSKLYYDTGSGLNEQECITVKTQIICNRFKVQFDLSKIPDIRYMRWEVTDIPCWCIIDRVDSSCQTGLLPQGRFIERKNKTYFFTEHPSYVIDTFTPNEMKFLKIEGRVERLNKAAMLKNLQELSDELIEKENVLESIFESKEKSQLTLMPSSNVKEQKNLLRKLARRLLKRDRRNQEKLKFVSMPDGCADVFQFENQVLHVAGWVFDSNYEMKDARIAYYRGGERIATHNYVTIYRSDVAKALGKPKAEASGFAMTAKVCTPFDLKVVLEYDTPIGVGGFILGEVKKNSENKELEIFACMDSNQLGDVRYFIEKQVVKKLELAPDIYGYTVDIIVPVYNGYDYLRALFSGVEKTNMKYRLLIVNDKSTDDRILPYLEQYAADHAETVIINNTENLGFLRSVNKALTMAENHVVLLNTDVEVSYQWLERLMYPIIFKERVATSTPFTNSGTICSFPKFCEDNPMFEGMYLWQVDQVFRTIKPQYPMMPTGVGFCMGMNLHAIHEVGLLDAEAFGKGYGEENDWCQRAIEAGYKNVQVDNLFVYHKHGGSFLSEDKRVLLAEHSKTLLEKHPNYERDVARYCQSDPMKNVRLYVHSQLLNQLLDVVTTVAFDHSLGGGATEYLEQKKKELLKKEQKFITIRYNIYENKFLILYEYKEDRIEFFTENLKWVLPVLGRVDEIWVNELVTYQAVFKVLDAILKWREDQGARLKMLMHDYFALCPAVNLMDSSGNYCGVGMAAKCNQCIPANRSNACLDYESAEAWRTHWNDFLKSCNEVTVFSLDTQKLIKKVYPNLKNLKLVPHKPHFMTRLKRLGKHTKTFNIGILGVLSYKKGLNVIRDMANVIESRNLNIRLRLIGETDGEIDSYVFSQTGRYQREQLPKLTLEQDIDVFFIPSIWPETFSYTTSEIMSMNMPIVVFDIGAPVERVSAYSKGLVLRCDATVEEIIEKIQSFAVEKFDIYEMPVNVSKVLFIAEEISFASRYRVEHFRETLLLQGYDSDYVQMEEIPGICIDSYNSVVIYRCSDVEKVKGIIKCARTLKIPVYYDIDDYIFEFDKISYLSFLKEEEYYGFRKKTEQIYQCMTLSDGFLTSTDILKEKIVQAFPDKQTVIKRNVSSMEMQILSMEAWRNTDKSGRKIWIGYFSGSGTHNKDFALVEETLAKIMEIYPDVYLRLGGVLQESSLGKFQNRIVRSGFIEWQELPELIASVDINLMPLENTDFHCCKSENKWMEAALVHVPSVVSRNKELEKVIVSGKTGFLCSNEYEWYTSLCMLIEDEDLRKSVGNAAYQRVIERYTTNYPDTEAVKMVLGN